MKKVCIIVIIVLSFVQSVFADDTLKNDDKQEILAKYDLVRIRPYTKLRRVDVITSIMKAIGVTKEAAEYYSNYIVSEQRTLLDIHNVYVKVAVNADIARGWNNFFHPGEYATYKQTILFMMRCINGCSEFEDENELIYDAEKIGLIKEEDSFYSNLENIILKDDFDEILYRFINTDRYLYCQKFKPITEFFEDKNSKEYKEYLERVRFKYRIKADEQHEMTYLEYLKQLKYNPPKA